jgi:hypothetical protein
MSISALTDNNEIRQELDRRLAILDDPDYSDPARADISGREIVIWFVIAAAISAMALLLRGWGA